MKVDTRTPDDEVAEILPEMESVALSSLHSPSGNVMTTQLGEELLRYADELIALHDKCDETVDYHIKYHIKSTAETLQSLAGRTMTRKVR